MFANSARYTSFLRKWIKLVRTSSQDIGRDIEKAIEVHVKSPDPVLEEIVYHYEERQRTKSSERLHILQECRGSDQPSWR
jgi:hypothetical protein